MAHTPADKKMISKHRSLKQDYDDLVRETQRLEARLQEAKERRSRLLGEVRFLRRKHKILTGNELHKSKKEKISQFQNSESPSRNGRWRKSSKEDGFPKQKLASLDLNQASEPMEQDEQAQVVWELPKSLKKAKVDGVEDIDPLLSSLKLSVFRGHNNAIVGVGGEGTERRVAKRKISWRDQVALMV